jgi:hypothetical protein
MNPTTNTKLNAVTTDIAHSPLQSDPLLTNRQSNIGSGRIGGWMTENSVNRRHLSDVAVYRMKRVFQDEGSRGRPSWLA